MIKYNGMYNEEQKNMYINHRKKDVSFVYLSNIELQFKRTAETEKELEKDVCNWNLYEIVDFYKMYNCTSYEVLLCINSTLSKYTNFCLENGLVKDNQNHFLECSTDTLESCINKAALDKTYHLAHVRKFPH